MGVFVIIGSLPFAKFWGLAEFLLIYGDNIFT